MYSRVHNSDIKKRRKHRTLSKYNYIFSLQIYELHFHYFRLQVIHFTV